MLKKENMYSTHHQYLKCENIESNVKSEVEDDQITKIERSYIVFDGKEWITLPAHFTKEQVERYFKLKAFI